MGIADPMPTQPARLRLSFPHQGPHAVGLGSAPHLGHGAHMIMLVHYTTALGPLPTVPSSYRGGL